MFVWQKKLLNHVLYKILFELFLYILIFRKNCAVTSKKQKKSLKILDPGLHEMRQKSEMTNLKFVISTQENKNESKIKLPKYSRQSPLYSPFVPLVIIRKIHMLSNFYACHNISIIMFMLIELDLFLQSII